jgi:hypothetical protein
MAQRYDSTPSFTSALDGVDGQRHAQAASPPPPRGSESLYRLSYPSPHFGKY